MEIDFTVDDKLYPHTHRGITYAKLVLGGVIVSCQEVIGACNRFFKDVERSKSEDCFFYFNASKSEKFLRLGQKFNHVKGEWKTPNIHFEDWQCFIFMNVYGFLRKDSNTRRFRTAYLEVARGNGKSAMVSIVGLFHLRLDDIIKGNEIYSAATGKEQSRIVLDSARAMAKANKSFCKKMKVDVLAHKIVHKKSNSFFVALASDSKSLDGLQPACALIDELHSHKNRQVYDVIDSAMSKRKDSLLFIITTAGFSITGIGYSQSNYAKKVCLGTVEDDHYFAIVYCLDKDDDEFDEKNWPKANPNWNVSVDPVNFKSKAMKAKENPEDKNNFLVKHVNRWSNAASPYFDIKKWEKCATKKDKFCIEDFKGEKCFAAVDLASKIDLTSKVYIFHPDENYYLFEKSYIPEARLVDSKNKSSYIKWAKEGWLNVIPGEVLDYVEFENEVKKDAKDYSIINMAYDPWNATEFAQRMTLENIAMVEFAMRTGNLSEPTKKLNALIKSGLLEHNGSPLLTWCLSNVVATLDKNDNIFPHKDHPDNKIDPIIASIMAIAGWMLYEKSESVYEKRGLIIL